MAHQQQQQQNPLQPLQPLPYVKNPWALIPDHTRDPTFIERVEHGEFLYLMQYLDVESPFDMLFYDRFHTVEAMANATPEEIVTAGLSNSTGAAYSLDLANMLLEDLKLLLKRPPRSHSEEIAATNEVLRSNLPSELIHIIDDFLKDAYANEHRPIDERMEAMQGVAIIERLKAVERYRDDPEALGELNAQLKIAKCGALTESDGSSMNSSPFSDNFAGEIDWEMDES